MCTEVTLQSAVLGSRVRILSFNLFLPSGTLHAHVTYMLEVYAGMTYSIREVGLRLRRRHVTRAA
jgi:predicted component of type VI protein secretion system